MHLLTAPERPEEFRAALFNLRRDILRMHNAGLDADQIAARMECTSARVTAVLLGAQAEEQIRQAEAAAREDDMARAVRHRQHLREIRAADLAAAQARGAEARRRWAELSRDIQTRRIAAARAAKGGDT